MRIFHIISNFGRPLYVNLLCSVSKHCNKQHVFHPYWGNNCVDYNLDEYNISYHQERILNFWTRLFYWYKLLIQNKAVIKSKNIAEFDIIHAHTLFSDGGLAYILNKKFQIPYIVAVRSTDISVFLKYKPWLKLFAGKILNNASQIISISPQICIELEKRFNKRYINKTLIIPNGIDKSFFETTIQNHITNRVKIQLLYVGRFYKLKNIDQIISYVKDNKKFVLTIVGDGGDDYDRIKTLIRASKNIIYKGRINDKEDLKKLYQHADIFIMPSINETFGLVYIEAMSQGTPVIYTKGTGIYGYFKEGEIGFGVDPYNFKEFNIAIEAIMNNYKQFSNNAIERAQQFTWSKIAEKYYSIYYNLL